MTSTPPPKKKFTHIPTPLQSGDGRRLGEVDFADNEKAFKDKQFFKCQMPAKTGHSYQSQLYY